MQDRKRLTPVLFVLLALLPGTAGALTISAGFTASGFESSAPFDPISGSYTVSVDELSLSSVGLEILNGSVDAIDLTIGPTSYDTGGVSVHFAFSDGVLDAYQLGVNLDSSGCSITSGSDSFCLLVTVAGSASLAYSTGSADGIWSSGTVDVEPVSEIPEPTAALLLLAGSSVQVWCRMPSGHRIRGGPR